MGMWVVVAAVFLVAAGNVAASVDQAQTALAEVSALKTQIDAVAGAFTPANDALVALNELVVKHAQSGAANYDAVKTAYETSLQAYTKATKDYEALGVEYAALVKVAEAKLAEAQAAQAAQLAQAAGSELAAAQQTVNTRITEVQTKLKAAQDALAKATTLVNGVTTSASN